MTPKVVAQLLYLLRQVPKAFLAAVLMLCVPNAAGSAPVSKAQEHANKAFQLREAHDYNKAIYEATSAIHLDPKLANAYLIRAQCLGYAIGKENQALADLKTAISLDPNLGAAYEELGQYYRELGQTKLAIVTFSEGIKHSPKWFTLYHARSSAYEEAGDEGKAIDDLSAYLKAHPMPLAFWWRGQAYEKAGQMDKALADYDTALSNKKELHRDIYRQRAKLLFKMARYKDSIKDCSTLIKFDPEEDQTLQLRAEAFAQLKEFPKAISDYTAAIAVSPDSAGKLHMARADLYDKVGKHELAEKDRRKAKELRGNPAEKPIY